MLHVSICPFRLCTSLEIRCKWRRSRRTPSRARGRGRTGSCGPPTLPGRWPGSGSPWPFSASASASSWVSNTIQPLSFTCDTVRSILTVYHALLILSRRFPTVEAAHRPSLPPATQPHEQLTQGPQQQRPLRPAQRGARRRRLQRPNARARRERHRHRVRKESL